MSKQQDMMAAFIPQLGGALSNAALMFSGPMPSMQKAALANMEAANQEYKYRLQQAALLEAKRKQKKGLLGKIGQIAGTAVGFAAGGPAGAAIGGSIGGTAGSLADGGDAGQMLGDFGVNLTSNLANAAWSGGGGGGGSTVNPAGYNDPNTAMGTLYNLKGW